MCGIAGFYNPTKQLSPEASLEQLERMRDSLHHRGPDDKGSWIDADCRIALGQRRLSILDLSPLGHQPMASHNGRYQIVFNGEVYNFQEIRQELQAFGHQFRGGSDTEVILAACCQWGPEATLARLNGMFAIALWDCESQRLLLARDRFGKKPIYFGKVNQTWVFASELKAFRTIPEFGAEIDRDSLALYIRFGHVPSPYSIYKGIQKLPASSFVWLPTSTDCDCTPQAYAPWIGQEDDIDSALAKAVKCRMISDVPLGAFLSGGIDSSLVVALMQEQSSSPVRTFSLGFAEDGFDEAVYARQVAQRLGTNHTEHYVTPKETLDVIPLLPHMYDEPFADSSQIPTYLVSKLARTQVTVALSGDGGDELFGGYNRHLWVPRIWRILSLLPVGLRKQVARLLTRVSLEPLSRLVGRRVAYPQDKLNKLTQLLPLESPAQLYKSLASAWSNPNSVVIGGIEPPTRIDTETLGRDIAQSIMRLDELTYLHDDILVKVDRASMAVSLEARAPLLDPNVAFLAHRLPLDQKIHGSVSKWALRQALYKRLPRELFERPKAGFTIPVGNWLRSELRPWAEDLLAQIPSQGYLRAEPIQERWQQHQQKRRDWTGSLWAILMFQAWLNEH